MSPTESRSLVSATNFRVRALRVEWYIVAPLAFGILPVRYGMWRGFVVNRWEGALLVCGYGGFLWISLGA